MIDSPGRSAYQNDEGRLTHYLEWGDPRSAKVLLLLHGFLGHAHWWDFVAPWFAADYRVMAHHHIPVNQPLALVAALRALYV
jgi:pimeloyl-ACP methyl ester carboxylesterase